MSQSQDQLQDLLAKIKRDREEAEAVRAERKRQRAEQRRLTELMRAQQDMLRGKR